MSQTIIQTNLTDKPNIEEKKYNNQMQKPSLFKRILGYGCNVIDMGVATMLLPPVAGIGSYLIKTLIQEDTSTIKPLNYQKPVTGKTMVQVTHNPVHDEFQDETETCGKCYMLCRKRKRGEFKRNFACNNCIKKCSLTN